MKGIVTWRGKTRTREVEGNSEVLKCYRRAEVENYLRARVDREGAQKEQSLNENFKDGQGF